MTRLLAFILLAQALAAAGVLFWALASSDTPHAGRPSFVIEAKR